MESGVLMRVWALVCGTGSPGLHARVGRGWIPGCSNGGRPDQAADPRAGSPLEAGQAAGAIELGLLSAPLALLHLHLRRLAPHLFSFNSSIGSLSSLAPPKEGFGFLVVASFEHFSDVTISLACRRYLGS